MPAPVGYTQLVSGLFIRDEDSSGPYAVGVDGVPWLLGPATSQANIFKVISALSIASEATIWDPAAGKKFRLMGFSLSVGGANPGPVTLRDGTGGATIYLIPFGALSAPITTGDLSGGILSTTANNVLTAQGSMLGTLSGTIWGREE